MPKFRVWDNKNRKFTKSPIVWFEDDEVRVFLDISDVVDWVEQTNVEVMQSTGLKDKNGVEIYEGDVLYSVFKKSTGDLYIYGAVYWDSEWSGWSVRDAKTEESFSLGRLSGVLIHGNIYENPELLK